MPDRPRVHLDGPADAEAIVWLGSLGASASMWDPQIRAFTKSHRSVRIELPGHGGSTASPGPYTIEQLAGRVVLALDELGIDRAHVAGLSIGGMTAIALAIGHAERVRSLSLLCTSAHLPPAEGWRTRAATVRAEGCGAVARAVVGRWLTPAYAVAHPGVVASFEEMISGADREDYAGCCEAIAVMDLRSQLGEISARTLVVAGEHDPATPPDHATLIVDAVENATLVLVAGAHLSSWECAAEVNAAIHDHVTGAGS